MKFERPIFAQKRGLHSTSNLLVFIKTNIYIPYQIVKNLKQYNSHVLTMNGKILTIHNGFKYEIHENFKI